MFAFNDVELICKFVGGNKTVLDCGCGGGGLARFMAINGCSVVGVEIDPKRAQAARQWCQAVIVGDLECEDTLARVCEHSTTFDCILCSHVLEHVRDPRQVLKNLLSFCQPRTG